MMLSNSIGIYQGYLNALWITEIVYRYHDINIKWSQTVPVFTHSKFI